MVIPEDVVRLRLSGKAMSTSKSAREQRGSTDQCGSESSYLSDPAPGEQRGAGTAAEAQGDAQPFAGPQQHREVEAGHVPTGQHVGIELAHPAGEEP